MLKKSKNRRLLTGFTLVELLIVISVITLLSGTVLVLLQGQRLQARDMKRIADSDSLRKALELYYTEYGEYPSQEAEGTDWCCLEAGVGESEECESFTEDMQDYISAMPRDTLYPRTHINGDTYTYCYYYKTRNNNQQYKVKVWLEKAGSFYEVYSTGGGDIPD